ncbi:unnamed protein product [Oppiella nova]|uniref:Uncharacterized protein n=1 Tax=Oppiella nova TaxID=334625 RepID=A0A7R9M1Y9_9ACAR|nr:unnamed protein product [Oppiella nova]CAG2168884.1 unnamed protein product [Oppiella nova]
MPVTNELSSDARNSMAFAMSVGSPIRPNGSARKVETYLYGISKLSGNKYGIDVCDGYKAGDWLGIGCRHEIVYDSSAPEHDDKIESVTFFKDNYLFLRSFDERYPVKGIDAQETEVGPLMDYVVITNYTGGANNETAGWYTCTVELIDYHVACESSARQVSTFLYRISKLSGDKVYIDDCDGYKVVPERNDEMLSVNFFKDDIPFLIIDNQGNVTKMTFITLDSSHPVKGIDLGKVELDMFKDYAVLTNTTGGANNETAGGYSCLVNLPVPYSDLF